MKLEDVKYLCSTIGGLAGLPVRIYDGEKRVFYYSVVNFEIDPITPYENKIIGVNGHIGYFITPLFHYYGIVNTRKYKIVIGPTRQWSAEKNKLTELAFLCGVHSVDTESFVSSMQALVSMPLNSLLQTLCAVNFALNGEKLSLSDLIIYDDEQLFLSREMARESAEKGYEQTERIPDAEAVHNTVSMEETIMNFVVKGETEALKKWATSAPAVRSGVMSKDSLRQYKNTFIVTATLVSRAAIRGGLQVDEALSLSDNYIQKCELLFSVEGIQNLQFHMVYDYTERVERLRLGKAPTKLMKEVSNYVQQHLSEPMNIDKMAKTLYLSRTHLATRFKEESGKTLTEFIQSQKTEEAKRLLRFTDKPISAVSEYLGFSSQSHFSNVFKKVAGLTPQEYRISKGG